MKRSHPLIASLVWVPLLALQTGLPGQQREPKPGKWSQHVKARYQKQGWVVLESRNYQIQSQAGEEKGKRLAEHMEAMLKVSARVLHRTQ